MNKLWLGLGIVLGFTVSQANAEVDGGAFEWDQKLYSAAGCGTKNDAATVTRGGAIYNTSTTTSNDLTCPVILDRFYDYDRYFYLVAFRATGAAAMPCYLNTFDGVSTTTTTQNVTTTGTDQYLYFNRLGSYISTANLGCAAPKKTATGSQSGVKRYEVTEY